ncbi:MULTISPECIES: DMT family transporter [unclassified Microbacterium]|uniref:DMT family transporter n=1 Tax=unclassified Microbacterium TaxID=2609290 RepID=UPI000EA8622B|nr:MULTISPECIES: DMT family transporter [unclassified Microbacterium]MBT2486133.1 DMT family transporter [Microbacterium sp. ISL-108]RKN68862.1 multidrug DMT transporter permease [Microbacterium sp. CGR2]
MNGAEDVGDQLVGAFQNPGLLLGIPLALAGAVFMSLGAQYQHRGVEKVERLSGSNGSSGLTLNQLKRLLTRPSWIAGTLMLAMAVVCQLAALVQAPLIVVQPLGAIALVMTTLLNARVSGHSPTKQSITAIICCVGGIFLFVFFAAIFATEKAVTERQLFVILAMLLVVIIVLGACWLILRHRMRALFYVIGAGILYGFVATLAKVVIKRIEAGEFEWITGVCVLALVAAAAVGAYFVQTAYSSGPPDLVIAGLTVVDPLVAVLIGMVVLGEASAAPPWVLVIFAIAGGIAVWGVVGLARYHPQVLSDSQDLGIPRGSGPSSSTPSPEPETRQDPEAR